MAMQLSYAYSAFCMISSDSHIGSTQATVLEHARPHLRDPQITRRKKTIKNSATGRKGKQKQSPRVTKRDRSGRQRATNNAEKSQINEAHSKKEQPNITASLETTTIEWNKTNHKMANKRQIRESQLNCISNNWIYWAGSLAIWYFEEDAKLTQPNIAAKRYSWSALCYFYSLRPFFCVRLMR